MTVFGKPWRTTTIRDMLTSPRVAGLRQHRGEIVGPAVWEPIITDGERRRIIAMLEQKRDSGRRTPRRYLLSGLLRCGRCDQTLYSSRRANSRRYVCLGGPDHRGCGRLTSSLPSPSRNSLSPPSSTGSRHSELADALAGRAAKDEQAAALAETVAGDNAQLDELAQAYAAKQITMREWMTARNPIEERMRNSQRQLDRITRTEPLAGFVGNGNELRGQWSDLNLDRRHAIIRAVLDHAVVAPSDTRGRQLQPRTSRSALESLTRVVRLGSPPRPETDAQSATPLPVTSPQHQ